MKLVIRWAITAVALVAAVWLIPGIRIESQNKCLDCSRPCGGNPGICECHHPPGADVPFMRLHRPDDGPVHDCGQWAGSLVGILDFC